MTQPKSNSAPPVSRENVEFSEAGQVHSWRTPRPCATRGPLVSRALCLNAIHLLPNGTICINGGADPLVRAVPLDPLFPSEINWIWLPASRPGGRLRTGGAAPQFMQTRPGSEK